MPRRSIEIKGFAHENPIPAATRIGPLLVSGIIPAFDRGTRNMPADALAQVNNLFSHMGEMLEGGGADWGDVAKITFHVTDIALRDVINGPWVEHFPDPESRPSRYTSVVPGGGTRISCEMLAYIEG